MTRCALGVRRGGKEAHDVGSATARDALVPSYDTLVPSNDTLVPSNDTLVPRVVFQVTWQDACPVDGLALLEPLGILLCLCGPAPPSPPCADCKHEDPGQAWIHGHSPVDTGQVPRLCASHCLSPVDTDEVPRVQCPAEAGEALEGAVASLAGPRAGLVCGAAEEAVVQLGFRGMGMGAETGQRVAEEDAAGKEKIGAFSRSVGIALA